MYRRIDLNELVRHFAPAFRRHETRQAEQRRSSLSWAADPKSGGIATDNERAAGGVSMAADLLGRAAVHLAGSASMHKKSFKKSFKRQQQQQQQQQQQGAHEGGAHEEGGCPSMSVLDAAAGGGVSAFGTMLPQLRLTEAASEATRVPHPHSDDDANASSEYGSDESDEDGARTLRTLAREAAARKRAAADAATHAKNLRAEDLAAHDADQRAKAELRADRGYLEKLRARMEETLAAGYTDNTRALTPRARRGLFRQMHQYDTSGEGHLDVDAFCALCTKLGEAALEGSRKGQTSFVLRGGGDGQGGRAEEPLLSRLQMIALFSQADVTGAHHICVSQWLWARTQLATLLEQQLRVRAGRAAREREETAARVAIVEAERKARDDRRMGAGFAPTAAPAAAPLLALTHTELH